MVNQFSHDWDTEASLVSHIQELAAENASLRELVERLEEELWYEQKCRGYQ